MSSSARHHSAFITLTELVRPQIVNPFATFLSRYGSVFPAKVISEIAAQRAQKSPACGGAFLCVWRVSPASSVAEEQPQQNDHRDRHAQQPKQNTFAHRKPSLIPRCGDNAAWRASFRA